MCGRERRRETEILQSTRSPEQFVGFYLGVYDRYERTLYRDLTESYTKKDVRTLLLLHKLYRCISQSWTRCHTYMYIHSFLSINTYTLAHKHTRQSGIIPASVLVGALSAVMADQSPDSFSPLLSDWGVLCLGTPYLAYYNTLWYKNAPADASSCMFNACTQNHRQSFAINFFVFEAPPPLFNSFHQHNGNMTSAVGSLWCRPTDEKGALSFSPWKGPPSHLFNVVSYYLMSPGTEP